MTLGYDIVAIKPVMPGLVPGSTSFWRSGKRKSVDGRNKSGHDA
jgi:hypothetical protein